MRLDFISGLSGATRVVAPASRKAGARGAERSAAVQIISLVGGTTIRARADDAEKSRLTLRTSQDECPRACDCFGSGSRRSTSRPNRWGRRWKNLLVGCLAAATPHQGRRASYTSSASSASFASLCGKVRTDSARPSSGRTSIAASQPTRFQTQGWQITGKILNPSCCRRWRSLGTSCSRTNLEVSRLAETSKIATVARSMARSMHWYQSSPGTITQSFQISRPSS